MSIAIIGTGWGARVQVPAFRSAGLDVVALAGSNQAKTERIAAELDVAHATSNWRALIERDEVALVSIVTPPDLHSEMAQAALAAGKHVLCEKPTALDLSQARDMLTAARIFPQQLALIDHELRFLPTLIEARRMIGAGELGAIRHASSSLIASSRSDPQRPWNWWSDRNRGGGLLGAIGSHQIDTLRYVLDAEVDAIAATLHTFITERRADGEPHPVTSDDYYSVRLRFDNGALANLESSLIARLDEPNRFTVYGENATLRWENGRLLYAAPNQPFDDITPPFPYAIPDGMSGEFPLATVALGHALRRFLEGDREAVAAGATFTDGLRIQAALDAARQSHRQGGGFVSVSS